MNTAAHNFLARATEKGLVTNKRRFSAELERSGFVLIEDTVQVYGYEGKVTRVPRSYPLKFTCTSCKKACIMAYGLCKCYHCA